MSHNPSDTGLSPSAVFQITPPGPAWQKINSILHQEPIATIVYGFYWSFALLFMTPIAVFVLQVLTILKLILYGLHLTGDTTFDPSSKRNADKELAIVITGCDSGIGRETALWAADSGFVVFAGCLQSSPKSFDEFRSISPNIIPILMDVTKDQDVKSAVKIVNDWIQEERVHPTTSHDDLGYGDTNPTTTTNNHGPTKKRILHAVINNAGIAVVGDTDWVGMSGFQRAMDVNFFGTVRCCKAFLPILKRQAVDDSYKGARILNITSMAGMVAGPAGLGPYGASKHAAQAFSQCLRAELSVFNIQVSTINPSFHGTGMVSNMDAILNASWLDASKSLRNEYGDEYYERVQYLAEQTSHRFLWKLDVAVDQIVKCLKRKRVPRKVVIGSDARFGIVALRMLPGWCLDLFESLEARSSPAIMKKRKRS